MSLVTHDYLHCSCIMRAAQTNTLQTWAVNTTTELAGMSDLHSKQSSGHAGRFSCPMRQEGVQNCLNWTPFFPPPSLQGPVVFGLHIYQPPLLSCELNLCNVNPWWGPGGPAEVDSPCPCPSQRQPLHPLCHLTGLLHVQTGKDVFSECLPRV